MLILARKVGQRIVIGDDISVTIVEVRGDQVRLGINAPRNVSVHRQELLDQLYANHQTTTQAAIDLTASHASPTAEI